MLAPALCRSILAIVDDLLDIEVLDPGPLNDFDDWREEERDHERMREAYESECAEAFAEADFCARLAARVLKRHRPEDVDAFEAIPRSYTRNLGSELDFVKDRNPRYARSVSAVILTALRLLVSALRALGLRGLLQRALAHAVGPIAPRRRRQDDAPAIPVKRIAVPVARRLEPHTPRLPDLGCRAAVLAA